MSHAEKNDLATVIAILTMIIMLFLIIALLLYIEKPITKNDTVRILCEEIGRTKEDAEILAAILSGNGVQGVVSASLSERKPGEQTMQIISEDNISYIVTLIYPPSIKDNSIAFIDVQTIKETGGGNNE